MGALKDDSRRLRGYHAARAVRRPSRGAESPESIRNRRIRTRMSGGVGPVAGSLSQSRGPDWPLDDRHRSWSFWMVAASKSTFGT